MNSHLYSIPLVAIDGNDMPCRLGSGCLIDLNNKRLLLGVRHVTDNDKNWTVHVEYIVGTGAKNYSFGAPTYIKRINLKNGSYEDLDFFCVEVPSDLLPKMQKVVGLNAIESEQDKLVFAATQISEPNTKVQYSFFGLTQPLLAGQFFEIQPIHVNNLSFLRDEDHRLVFSLATKHPGHPIFQGTSGAPIIDDKGNLVGLVMGGCEQRNEIFAFPLSRYASALYAQVQA